MHLKKLTGGKKQSQPMNKCYLGLGSNQKEPERQIRRAIKAIQSIPLTCVTQASKCYWNKAWGMETQQDFCNVVVEVLTRLSPHALLKKCNAIEKQQARVRKKRWGPRTIDIDIILYGNRKISTRTLCVPHPHMMTREFVLHPLLQINPSLQLPSHIAPVSSKYCVGVKR